MKKEESNKELLKEARKAKTQEQVWKVVNRERKIRVKINREIRTKEWEKYFKKILAGLESKGGTGRSGKRERGRKGRGRRRGRERDKLGGDGKADKKAENKKCGRGGRATK